MMRTTVRIDDDLLRELKDRAHREETSLTKVLDSVLRRGLANGESACTKREPYREKTFDTGVPMFDVNKAAALADELEDEARMERMAMMERLARGK